MISSTGQEALTMINRDAVKTVGTVLTRATAVSAGWDVTSTQTLTLWPGKVTAVNTGLRMELPPNIEAQVRSRSGLALKGVIVANAPGTIDPDFRGEVKVLLLNVGTQPYLVTEGDRIAQIVFAEFVVPTIEQADVLSETERGEGGFGSTGV